MVYEMEWMERAVWVQSMISHDSILDDLYVPVLIH